MLCAQWPVERKRLRKLACLFPFGSGNTLLNVWKDSKQLLKHTPSIRRVFNTITCLLLPQYTHSLLYPKQTNCSPPSRPSKKKRKKFQRLVRHYPGYQRFFSRPDDTSLRRPKALAANGEAERKLFTRIGTGNAYERIVGHGHVCQPNFRPCMETWTAD